MVNDASGSRRRDVVGIRMVAFLLSTVMASVALPAPPGAQPAASR